MSNYLESCNNECKILMLIVIAVLCVLVYQYYQKYMLCATKEGFNQNIEQKRIDNETKKNNNKPCKQKILGICVKR
jgi:hypothetical protein